MSDLASPYDMRMEKMFHYFLTWLPRDPIYIFGEKFIFSAKFTKEALDFMKAMPTINLGNTWSVKSIEPFDRDSTHLQYFARVASDPHKRLSVLIIFWLNKIPYGGSCFFFLIPVLNAVVHKTHYTSKHESCYLILFNYLK